MADRCLPRTYAKPADRVFHVIPYGETTPWPAARAITEPPRHDLRRSHSDDARPDGRSRPLRPVRAGFLVGILVGEGHFGGDGRQPQVTLRMHTDHEALFRWLVARLPGQPAVRPLSTTAGRSYYQWMARGPFLRERLLPILEAHLTPSSTRAPGTAIQQMRDGLSPVTAPDARVGRLGRGWTAPRVYSPHRAGAIRPEPDGSWRTDSRGLGAAHGPPQRSRRGDRGGDPRSQRAGPAPARRGSGRTWCSPWASVSR